MPQPLSRAPRRSIEVLIGAYLAQLAGGKRRVRDAGGSLDLLRHGLNGYGYQHVSRADVDRWSAAFNAGEEDAFCRMFDAREIPGTSTSSWATS